MCMVRNRARFARVVVVVVDGARARGVRIAREPGLRAGTRARAGVDVEGWRAHGRVDARANTVACILMHAIIAIDARRRRRRRAA